MKRALIALLVSALVVVPSPVQPRPAFEFGRHGGPQVWGPAKRS